MNKTIKIVLIIYLALVVVIGVGYVYTITLLGDSPSTHLFGNAFNLVLGAAVGALSTTLSSQGAKKNEKVETMD
jgi:ABC-type Co2+ transport system permease subunit